MLMRNILIVIGALALIAGLALSVAWFNQAGRGPIEAEVSRDPSPAILVAARPIASGTLLRSADIAWQEVGPTETRPGTLSRGHVSASDYFGAVSRRDFGVGEPLTANDLVRPNDREFLAAALKPGTRAVSISVDSSQSASGLILPGDFVDVILIQNFGDSVADHGHKLVGETVLVDVRAIAVDQSLNATSRAAPTERRTAALESPVPKTVTLELSPREAEVLLVAGQLGRLGVSVRALEGTGAKTVGSGESSSPTWASDVSPALKELGGSQTQPYTSGSSVEKSIRRVPPPSGALFAPSATEVGKQ